MKIITLLENKTNDASLKAKHGLSFYIEVDEMKLLFDVGPDDTFIRNAKKLGISIEEVDIVVISHGHFDHGGGLDAFLKINNKADIYIGKDAFDDHIVKVFKLLNYRVGLNKKLKDNSRINVVDGVLKLGGKLTLFNGISGLKLRPKGNDKLLKKTATGIIKDDFSHELNLIIKDEKNILLAGCAHCGIVNIIEKAKDLLGEDVDVVIGGMHLMGIKEVNDESRSYMDSLTYELNSLTVSEFLTCHCTGDVALSILKKYLSNVTEINTGDERII